MPKKELDIAELQFAAKEFCARESGLYRPELFGVTDGKAVGTFVERLFLEYLGQRYQMVAGNSASGLDLPSLNTDIKVTSVKQPQSSCPFKDSKQKIYGLGYNLIVFVYQKSDDVQGRTKTYEHIVKGEPMPTPGLPESFNVLLHELRGLGLSVNLI